MAEIPDRFLVHRAAVYTVTGQNALGEVLASSVEFPCFISHKRRMVRGANGDEIVSETTISARLDVYPYVTPGSEIVLHTEDPLLTSRAQSVISASPAVDGGMGAWQHTRVVV